MSGVASPLVAVVGAGLIGRSWAVTFARGGLDVRLYDPVARIADEALPAIGETLAMLSRCGLLGGQEPAAVQKRIVAAATLGDAVDGVGHVQENAPEKLDVKRALYAELDAAVPAGAVIASSTSALLPSQLSAGLPGAHRCLVAHPLNPPHLIPAVEIVPSEWTSEAVVEATGRLMAGVGQKPVIAHREIAGFIMNRLQGALLDEAFALVKEGYTTVEDIDVAMRDGLARRWSFMGPFETIDLNAPDGVADFIERYGAAYAEIGRLRPARHAWAGALSEQVVSARRAAVPSENLPERQAWRDRRLAALAAHINEQDAKE